MPFATTSGCLFFGAESAVPVSWNALTEFEFESTNEQEDQPYATMRSAEMYSCDILLNNEGATQLMEAVRPLITQVSKSVVGSGPRRNRMIAKAKSMRTNFTETFIFKKEGDEYVDERSSLRFVLQGL